MARNEHVAQSKRRARLEVHEVAAFQPEAREFQELAVVDGLVGHHRDHELSAVEPEGLCPVLAGGVHGGEVQHLLTLRALLFDLAFLELVYDRLAMAVAHGELETRLVARGRPAKLRARLVDLLLYRERIPTARVSAGLPFQHMERRIRSQHQSGSRLTVGAD